MKDPSLFFSAPPGSNTDNFSDNNGDRPLSPRDKHERRLVGRRRDPTNNWRGALKERRNRLRIRLRPQARGAQPLTQPLRQPPTWGSPSAWRPDLRRVSLGVGGAAAPIPMSSDQQEEVYDNVQDIHQESRVTGGDVSLNANAATHGHSADQPPRVYEMDAFRTKEDAAVAQDSATAADSSYESYDKVPSESAEGKYPAARPGSKYGAPVPTAGKYPSATSTEVKAEGKYPAAVPGSHYGAPPVEAEPTWQEHPWVQPVTPLPFAIDPPRLPFRPRPVIIDTCNCAAYNTFGAAAGTTALVLNAVLFVLLAIANGGSGRSQVSARDKSKYEAHFGGGDAAEGVMAALPPLSPEISHQALRFACDLMGFTQPDYGGHDNFVLSKPTDLNAALHNITHAVAIGDGLYGDPSQSVHLVQGPPGGDVIIQEKPQGVQIITAGSSVNMQGGTPGGSQVSPGIMVVRPVNQASTGSRPSPGTTIQVLGGSTTNTNVNCNGGLCIETVSGVLPVDASPSPSTDTRPTSQTIARPPGIVTMASFQPGSGLPPEQIVSLGESGPAEVLPGEILTDIASLPGEDQPRPPGLVGLPALQGMANVVIAGGGTNTGAPGGSTVSGASSTSGTPSSSSSQGAVDSPASVESLLQNLLSASGITNGPTGQLTRPEVTDPTPLPPNRLSTPSPPPPVPTSLPSVFPSPSAQIPSQLPGVSQPSLPSDVTNGIISNINCLISGMVDGDGLGVVERPCVLPSRPPSTSSGASGVESAVQPPLEPIAGVFVTPPSHVITDGLITVGSDGVMTTTFVGEGTWFAPTDPSDLSTGVGQPASTGSQPLGGTEDGGILISDITGGVTEDPENAELPDFIGGDGAGAGITPDSVDISSTVEILSTLGTVEDLEEIPLKGGYFELHIHPTQPIPSPTPSELEFRFPPITIITTTYPSSATLTTVRGPAPVPTRTLQLTPSVTRLTTITTLPPYYVNPTPSSANPTTSWGDEIVYNDLGFWKPPTRQPPSFLNFKRKAQRPSSTVHLDLSHDSLDPAEESILESLLPGVDDDVNQLNTPDHPNVPEDNPFAGKPEPTELANLFSQLEPSAPIDNSPDDVINIQQIDPTAPMMMMMAARLNLTNSPIISVLPKPPFLVPAGFTPTTTLITIGGPLASISPVVTGSTGYIPPGSGFSSGTASNPGTGTSAQESHSEPGIFISLQQQNGGTSNHLTNGDHDSYPSGSLPFQTVSGVLPVTKKPDRLSTWNGYKGTTTTTAPLAFQSGGWFNLFEVPTTTEKPKFNKMGFWKPTRRPLIFNRMKYKQIRKGGSVSSSRVHLLGRHKDNGDIAADEDSSPGYEEDVTSTTTQRPSSSPLTGKPGTSTLPPRITTADITYAAAEGSLPSLIQSLFSKPNAGYPNSPDTKRVTKPQNQRTSKPTKRPPSPTTTEPAPVTSASPPSPSPTPREPAAPTPRFNKFGFWKPTKRPYSSMMQRIRQRMKDRTRPPVTTTTGTTKGPAPPPVGPPTLPPRRSFVNGNFLPDQKRSQGWRSRRDLSPPSQEASSSSSPLDAVPASMDVLLDSVGRNFGAASGVQSSSEARMFRHQFRPAGRHRRQFSGRCITRCWLGTVGILGGFGGLAALSVPVYLLLVGSLGGSGTGAGSAASGGLAGAVAGAAAAAGGVVGVPFAIDEPIPVTGPVPIPLPNPVPPGPIPIPLPDPLPPDVPSPKPPGTPDEPKPPAPPDTGTGLPPGVPEEETAKPPAPPTIDTDAAPGPFIEGPDKVVTTFVNVDPAEGENVGGTAVPPETSVFIEQISQPGTRPDPIGVIGIPQEPDRISAVLGQNFGPETAECKNYKLCILHAKTQDTSKRKPPRWFFTTYLYEGTFASLCQQMARKPTTELCRKLFPHCINTTKFGLGY